MTQETLTMPTLGFEPEPLDALRARFPDALNYLAFNGTTSLYRVGRSRVNVFDFEDGIRLMVSREAFPPPDSARQFIHVSASVTPDSKAEREIRASREPAAAFLNRARTLFKEVSGGLGPMEFVRFDGPKGIPHWTVPYQGGDQVE
jgi:hypothetical protein